MKVKLRVAICRLTFYALRGHGNALIFGARLLKLPVATTVWFVTRANYRKLEQLKGALSDLSRRANSFEQECQMFLNAKTRFDVQRRHLSEVSAELTREKTCLVAAAQALLMPHPAIAPWNYLLASISERCFGFRRKLEGFSRILAQVETSPNFYWELLLWFILPAASAGEQMGDLSEEHRLRSAADGEVCANTWYRRQVISSAKARYVGQAGALGRNRNLA